MMNCVFVFACITVFTSTRSLGTLSVPREDKTSLIKVINSTNAPNQLRQIVLQAEDSYETTSKVLDTHMDVLKLVLAYAGFVACYNTWCLFLLLRQKEESSANPYKAPGLKSAR
jgi:hypothetical protein